MISFTVNGKRVEAEEVSIQSYLASIGINPGAVVVELNYEIPPREKWSNILIKSGDNLEIVKFIGGG